MITLLYGPTPFKETKVDHQSKQFCKFKLKVSTNWHWKTYRGSNIKKSEGLVC